ncbi:hypothetical protein H105_04168 [Trichophyton soudanense CBS 452.61]|uniref:Uncharacterized protein n=1 Tax=Trichophyton soudanense CBS 452.61 TaxID=1215331 RepID=A0A022XUU1_TRISD|nr:hypothetical protein H105_04168 [Trichophyton soudanense CBS 452.61]
MFAFFFFFSLVVPLPFPRKRETTQNQTTALVQTGKVCILKDRHALLFVWLALPFDRSNSWLGDRIGVVIPPSPYHQPPTKPVDLPAASDHRPHLIHVVES